MWIYRKCCSLSCLWDCYQPSCCAEQQSRATEWNEEMARISRLVNITVAVKFTNVTYGVNTGNPWGILDSNPAKQNAVKSFWTASYLVTTCDNTLSLSCRHKGTVWSLPSKHVLTFLNKCMCASLWENKSSVLFLDFFFFCYF